MRKISLTGWILIAMLAGILTGLVIHFNASKEWITGFSSAISLVTEIFLRLIKMIIAPLVFSTLVVGIAKLGDIKAVGRIGGKTLLWFLSMSLISLLFGMVMMNILQLGEKLHLPLPETTVKATLEQTSISFKNFIEHVFPESIVEAMATNQILQIVAFSVFFGIATAAIGEQGKIIIKGLDAVAHVVLKMTGYVMKLAPLAAFSAITAVLAIKGPEILYTYGKFIISFYASILCLWAFLILIASLFIGKRALQLVYRVKDAVLLAFSTASSESAFPQLLSELEEFGCPNKIVSFVLPLGYSFNLDGSMLYMTFASLFIAQAYGMHMPLMQQVSMLLVLMLTSKGIAGVPRASLVVIAGTLSLFNIPQQGLLLLLGIDQILDMARSATNVVGNSLATAVVSKMENSLGIGYTEEK
ncbi:MAG: dicarboxylate/amino acid:cation symporter [Bacteroidetes bacterium]|nr:dicarboxylate/amino acid:cation symporter [Bacteroidota bacterium]MBS1934170.1 dicarboxylate/amino acid:cation symporter [Bacteroidota bacterium]